MKNTPIRFKIFLEENKICAYFLHKSIKQKITDYDRQLAIYRSSSKDNETAITTLEKLEQLDDEILKSIKKHLIDRIRKKLKNDIEIVAALKRIKWTIAIEQEELRAMGLESNLFWNTTIFGRLKLVRVGDYTATYYIVPFAKRLNIRKLLASIRTSGKHSVEFE